MKLLVCIDDTDNMESIGSGELLEIMGNEMAGKGLGKAGFITRHQLLVHPDIPYTSHNSSMCSQWETDEEKYPEVLTFIIDFLKCNHAEGSDPGLCVIKKDLLDESMIKRLVSYGKCAKTMILRKWEAEKLAAGMPEQIHLSEHGGTGDGIIGALAGCGLRLSGQDGRMKGKIYPENAGIFMPVEQICRRYPFDEVRTEDGAVLEAAEKVRLGEELKGIYLDHKIVLLVKQDSDGYRTCGKKELKKY